MGWTVWRVWRCDGSHFFRLDLKHLLLGPGIQYKSAILFISETFSIGFDADLTAGSFERALECAGLVG